MNSWHTAQIQTTLGSGWVDQGSAQGGQSLRLDMFAGLLLLLRVPSNPFRPHLRQMGWERWVGRHWARRQDLGSVVDLQLIVGCA